MKIKLFIGLVLLAMLTVAFRDKEKEKVRVHIIHEEGGQTMFYDTVFTITEQYDVNSFLMEKGLDPANTEIIDLDRVKNLATTTIGAEDLWYFNGSDGLSIDCDKMIWNSEEGNNIQRITMMRMVDEDGNVSIQKTINGEVVEGDEIDIVGNFDSKALDSAIKIINTEVIENGQHTETFEIKGGDASTGIWIDSTGGQKIIGNMNVRVIGAHEVPADLKKVIILNKQIEVETEGNEPSGVMMFKSGTTELPPFTIAIVSKVEDEKPKSHSKAGNSSLTIDNLNFFPKPNDGHFTLAFDLSEKGTTQILIHNINGQEVFSQTLNNFKGHYEEKIDISSHPTGTYILSISQNGKRLADKVIIH